jgi:hypothetical protein
LRRDGFFMLRFDGECEPVHETIRTGYRHCESHSARDSEASGSRMPELLKPGTLTKTNHCASDGDSYNGKLNYIQFAYTCKPSIRRCKKYWYNISLFLRAFPYVL